MDQLPGRKSPLRVFIILFVGQTFSQLGSSMTGFALIIWAYTQQGQVLASSLLAVCSTIPYLAVGLIGGAFVDRASKKSVMLVCDALAAFTSLIILICFRAGVLQLWILCLANAVSGLMNAFQQPASQVAITLLVAKEDYTRVGGLQAAGNSLTGILAPIFAALLLSFGGLGLVLAIDLATFLFAFITLLLLISIPEQTQKEREQQPRLWMDMQASLRWLQARRGLLLLLIFYGVLELVGAISFDSMNSPLLLARTNNDEMAVGIVSAFGSAGAMASSMLLTIRPMPRKKLPAMFAGSLLCLTGIALFGLGRNLPWWCIVVFCGCFGMPIYYTMQTTLLRERVPVEMQGRIFALQGTITQILAPLGYILGALLADYLMEPFMLGAGGDTPLTVLVGNGAGAGMGLQFFLAGMLGIIILLLIYQQPDIRMIDVENDSDL